MRTIISAATIIMLCCAAFAAADDKQAEALQKLEGKWDVLFRAAGFKEGTKQTLPVMEVWLKMGDQLELKQGVLSGSGKESDKWRLTLDPSSDPPTIDLALDSKKQTFPGIYRYDDAKGQLEITMGVEKTRPTKFESADRVIHVVLKRAK